MQPACFLNSPGQVIYSPIAFERRLYGGVQYASLLYWCNLCPSTCLGCYFAAMILNGGAGTKNEDRKRSSVRKGWKQPGQSWFSHESVKLLSDLCRGEGLLRGADLSPAPLPASRRGCALPLPIPRLGECQRDCIQK